MATKGIHHVSVTVTDFDRSKAFYDKVLGWLGAKEVMAATGAPHKHPEGRMALYAGEGFMFGIWEAFPEHRQNKHDRYNVGMHHFAFLASSRADIDDLHEKLKADGIEVLDAPAEYPYAPGYYAVYFADPDGMKIELMHVPA
jgi:catechol 2,3-dioxygenase-like lactoylglutathione lyase family enzyme